MTISIDLAGQSVAGILSDSELDSTPQGKYNYVVFSTFTFHVRSSKQEPCMVAEKQHFIKSVPL